MSILVLNSRHAFQTLHSHGEGRDTLYFVFFWHLTFKTKQKTNLLSLSFISAKNYVGTNGLVTGWGTLKEDGKPSCILQEVEVPVISNEVCSTETNYTSSMITDNMMCAGYLGVGNKDSCQGDSGGPMVAERPDKRYELIGVVSWGNGCARPYYPGVYTRVTKYLDWIKENSNDGCFCNE